MMRIIFLLVSTILINSAYGNDTFVKVSSYFDGPYVLLKENGNLKTVWVSEGELYEKEFLKNESFEFAEPSLPNIIVPEKEKWTTKPKGSYHTDERVVALSDIHGQYDVFVKLLHNHKIINEDLKWSFGKGHLVIVGDVMDRGDRVLECLWLIYNLEKEAEKHGGKLHFLLGNHELMIMNGVLNYLHPKYKYTSALMDTPYDQLFSKQAALGKWLSSKNVLLKLNDVLYVHGGLSQQTMSLELGIDQINDLFKKKIYYQKEDKIGIDPMLSALYYGDGPLWYRGYAFPYSFNKEAVDNVLKTLRLKSIVVGHTSLPEIKGLYDNKIVLIDSSIKLGESGQLLISEHGKYYVGKFDGTSFLLQSEETKSEENKSLFQYLYEQQEISIHVSDDLKTIEKNFEKEVETIGSVEIITNNDKLIFTAEFEPGGNSRRKICRMPPLKMNFKKSELDSLNFRKDFDKMKIVLQCQSGGSMADAIRKEKFIYDLYGLVSLNGFRSKMVQVKIGNNKKYVDGFIIESDDDLEYRQNITILKNKTIATSVIDREEYIKMCLFQFMISNADWSARKGHNTDLFKRNEDNSLIIIPFDFDYSGIVDNDYAVPPENLPISDVTDRYFMDKSVKIEELKKGVAYFLGIENDVYALCDNSGDLSDGTKKRMKKFIEGFYKIIKDEKKIKRMIRK